MKNLIILLLLCSTIVCQSQENHEEIINDSINLEKKNIKTISAKFDNIIDVVLEDILVNKKNKNLTFLIEVTSRESIKENLQMLIPALKYLSKKLDDNSKISLITYSKSNRVLIKNENATNINKLLKSLSGVTIEIKNIDKNGIDLAYKIADDYYKEESENIVILLRDDAKMNSLDIVFASDVKDSLLTQKKKNAKKTTIFMTAISILPEIIKVIK